MGSYTKPLILFPEDSCLPFVLLYQKAKSTSGKVWKVWEGNRLAATLVKNHPVNFFNKLGPSYTLTSGASKIINYLYRKFPVTVAPQNLSL